MHVDDFQHSWILEGAKGHAGALCYRLMALLCIWFSMRVKLEVFGFLLLVPKSAPPPFKIAVFYSIYLILGISAVALVAPPSGTLLKTRNWDLMAWWSLRE